MFSRGIIFCILVHMTEQDNEKLFEQTDALLAILEETQPFSGENGYNLEAVKNCVIRMTDFIVADETEAASLINWLNTTDFWKSPASTKFHGDFEGGLALHSLKVLHQALLYTKPVMENFMTCPNCEKYVITAEDIFVAAITHDFCKADSYKIEYRNTKDLFGNWIKKPMYKTRLDLRNLGHGNESVLKLLEIMPGYIKKRHVLEAISRHMGFSDLSESESYNYSNFLDNPLVILIQIADQTAAQWFGW